ncbi:MAG TPA: DUF4339 domain-containing protein [Chthoniobacteraceae bacterium]|jgi:hypothetical protein|nr:DUF4339 domain-containing protein [Chthoniobacteraceae bacterium]
MQIFVAQSNRQTGPFSSDQIEIMLNSGAITLHDSAWCEGLSDWQPLYQVLNVPPPLAQPPLVAPSVTWKSRPMFLYIPTSRLIVMSIVSLGLYEAYWIYRNWRYLNERDGLMIQPFWRGIFGVFFIHSLLTRIKNDRETNQFASATFSPGWLGTGWIALMLVGRIMDNSPDAAVNLAGLVISAPTFCFLLPAQKYINAVNEASGLQPSYYRFSGGHITCLVIGILAWLVIIAGMFA